MKTTTLVLTATVLGFLLAGMAPATANHPQQFGMEYLPAIGFRINHGVNGVTGGPAYAGGCGGTIGELTGTCRGGATIHSHPDVDSDDCNSTDCHNYVKVQSTATDTLTGPNIYTTICLYHPDDSDGICQAIDQEQLDGVYNAPASGCGIALLADAEAVPGDHPGNHHLTVFTFNLWVDPTVNEVCLGTSGTIAIIFLE